MILPHTLSRFRNILAADTIELGTQLGCMGIYDKTLLGDSSGSILCHSSMVDNGILIFHGLQTISNYMYYMLNVEEPLENQLSNGDS